MIAATGVTGSQLNRATPILAKLAHLFRDYDMTLAEINPLAELTDGSFVALDAHMEMENEAVGRQKKLLRKELGIAEDDTREAYEHSAFEEHVAAIDAADHRGVIQGKDHGFTGNLGLVIGAGIYDGVRKLPTFVFSDMGGIDIEEVAEQHPDHIGRGHFSTLLPHMDFRAKDAIASIGITGSELNRLTPILSKLAQLFVKYGLTLAEINPLAQLEDGTFVAVDAHMDMENEARPRQQELLAELGIADEETREAREPTPFEIEGERIDAVDHRGVAGNVTEFDGNLELVIGAGGGSLTLFDAVQKNGGKPANYCEIGGNPSVSKACNLTKLVLSKPGVDKIAVMMSIVSNTRVDIVARGVIKACVELGFDPAEKIAIFRIPGAWEEEGFKILEKYGVEYADRSVSLHEAARRGNVTEFDGNLGLVIGAGGGSLTLFDAVRKYGGEPANYCEIGGNPSVAKACGLAKEVLEKDGVEKIAVMMSIVSNTRVDIVARGVIKACLELGTDPGETIAIFRIPGAWEDEGFKILDRYGVEYCDRSVSMWEAAGRAVAKIQGEGAAA